VNKLPRLLAGALAAALAGGLLGACDASPYAAVVNGTVIKQTALNQTIRYGDQSRYYLALEETIHDQATGQTINLAGQGSGTHSLAWADLELTDLIQSSLIRQAVTAGHRQPSSSLLDAARGVLQAEVTVAGMASLPPSFRDQLVDQIAEHAAIEPAPTGQTATAIRQIYQHYRPDFYSQVCVRQITVSVTNPSGGINYGASLARARQVVAQFNATASAPSSGSGVDQLGGSFTCYSLAQMESQPVSFVNAVMKLAPGRASQPQRSGLGYNLTAVTSRRTLPFDGAVARAIYAVILQRQPLADTAVRRLDARARVKVLPAYGTWFKGSKTVAPGVIPPKVSERVPGS
jgi:hypothetical protein